MVPVIQSVNSDAESRLDPRTLSWNPLDADGPRRSYSCQRFTWSGYVAEVGDTQGVLLSRIGYWIGSCNPRAMPRSRLYYAGPCDNKIPIWQANITAIATTFDMPSRTVERAMAALRNAQIIGSRRHGLCLHIWRGTRWIEPPERPGRSHGALLDLRLLRHFRGQPAQVGSALLLSKLCWWFGLSKKTKRCRIGVWLDLTTPALVKTWEALGHEVGLAPRTARRLGAALVKQELVATRPRLRYGKRINHITLLPALYEAIAYQGTRGTLPPIG